MLKGFWNSRSAHQKGMIAELLPAVVIAGGASGALFDGLLRPGTFLILFFAAFAWIVVASTINWKPAAEQGDANSGQRAPSGRFRLVTTSPTDDEEYAPEDSTDLESLKTRADKFVDGDPHAFEADIFDDRGDLVYHAGTI